MGASFFAFFILPFLLVPSLLVSIFFSVTGLNISDISLPYDPEKGLVWEYDNKDDIYIDLVETVIRGDEQVFRFKRNRQDFIADTGCMMDLVFTAENGSTETYYASTKYVGFGKTKILSEDEVAVFEFTVNATETYDDSVWIVDSSYSYDDHVLYSPDMKENPKTVTVAYELGSDDDDKIYVGIRTCSEKEDYLESFGVLLYFTSGEAELIREDHYIKGVSETSVQ